MKVVAFMNVEVARIMFQAYDEKLGKYTPYLGFSRGSNNEKVFLGSFMLGHITGYLGEVLGLLVVGGVLTEGIGDYLFGIMEVNKAGRMVQAVRFLSEVNLKAYRTAGNLERGVKILIDYFRLMSAVGEVGLGKLLDEAAVAGRASKYLVVLDRYAAASEVVQDGKRIVPVLEGIGRALGKAEHPAEALITLGRIAEKNMPTPQGAKAITFTEKGVGDTIAGIDRLVSATKRGEIEARVLEQILSSLDNDAAVAQALGKLQGADAFASRAEMLEHFFIALAKDGWDGQTLAKLDRLISRWATTQPPPAEAILDIVAIIGKYGKRLALTDPGATARIVRQIDRFGSEGDDVVRALVALEKSYAEGSLVSKLDLDWLARNMEAGRLGQDTRTAEALARSTRIGPEDENPGGFNSPLFRWLQEWRRAADPELEIAQLVNQNVKPALGNRDMAVRVRGAGSVLTDAQTAPDPVTGLSRSLLKIEL